MHADDDDDFNYDNDFLKKFTMYQNLFRIYDMV